MIVILILGLMLQVDVENLVFGLTCSNINFAYPPAVLGLNPKYTIYTFTVKFGTICVSLYWENDENKLKEARFGYKYVLGYSHK